MRSAAFDDSAPPHDWRERALGAGDLNDAKEIAVRVFQYNEITAWVISPGIAAGSEFD
jgi:hypothetical protein